MPDHETIPPEAIGTQPVIAADPGPAQPPEFAYEAAAEEEWAPSEETLPPRARRRLIAPLPLGLAAVLLIACGFIAGVLVEKGESSSSSTTAGGGGASALASRFAALRAGASTRTAGGAASGAAGGAFGAAAGGGSGGATSGTVAFIQGSTLYVTSAEGNTIKVRTSAGSSVTKTVKTSVTAIHPGETVLVTGSPGANGAITAESIRVGATGGGGLAALFGGTATRGGAGSSDSSTGGSTTGAAPSLFGPGG